MRSLFIFHHLWVLAQTFLELKMDSPAFVPKEQTVAPLSTPKNDSFSIIPVRMPNTKQEVSAVVSSEDYEKLVAITPVWHVSSSGYVITSKRQEGKNKVTYMHRVILGESGTHLNGDKFDNRRSNLQPSLRRCDYRLSTISPILDFVYKSTDELPVDSSHVTIDYENGMIYKGEIHNSIPHGFGTLYEDSKHKVSLGWWLQGAFKSGIVLYPAPLPKAIKEEYNISIPQIKQAVLVVNGKAQL
jgi:hypothetical protein